jgi:dihydrofolate reductase
MIKDVEVYNSIENCCEKLKQDYVKKIFVIGGKSVYESFYSKASALHLTIISEDVEGIDTFFPIPLDSIKENFQETERFELSKTATYINWKR